MTIRDYRLFKDSKAQMKASLVFLFMACVINADAETLLLQSKNSAGTVAFRMFPDDQNGISTGATGLSANYPFGARVWIVAPLKSGNNFFVGWELDGSTYDKASAVSVAMNSNKTLTAVYNTPSCKGISVDPGIDSLHRAVSSNVPGSTYCIRKGSHRFTKSVVPKYGDKFIGDPGAILSGALLINEFVNEGNLWVAQNQVQEEPFGSLNLCLPENPECIYAEKLFVDGIEYTQVTSLSALGENSFYFDYTADKIYLTTDPRNRKVEATNGSGGIVGFSDLGSIEIRNLIFEKFGGAIVPGDNNAPIKAKAGWIVENNTFRYNSNRGVTNYGGIIRNNHIHHSGRVGIVGNNLIEGNLIENNNTDGFNPSVDAGGSKFFRTVGLKLRGNQVKNNQGRGLWADTDNKSTLYENNILEGNQEMGIYHEVGCDSIVTRNVFIDNNKVSSGKSLWHGAQLYIRTSKNMEIKENLILAGSGGAHSIGLRGGDLRTYSYPNCGDIRMSNFNIHDNIVFLDSAEWIGFVGADVSALKSSTNQYYASDSLGSYFFDGGKTPISFKEWQAEGFDINSTINLQTKNAMKLNKPPPLPPQIFIAE